MKLAVAAGLFLAPSFPVRGDLFLDGSTLPAAPWINYKGDGETSVVDFFDPVLGATNKALRINSGSDASEWYYGAFAADEVVGAARFRLVDFTAVGKENLLCVTTSPPSDTNAPAPAITLVDGRYKLWSYVNLNSEILDIAPAVSNEWHTAYISTRKDGRTKLWWDGALIFDGTAPPANPYGGYLEWGSGSWQYDATDTVDFDWVGYSVGSGAPILVSTVPADGTPIYNAAAGFTFNVLKSAYGVGSNGVAIAVDGVDRTGDLVVTGDNTNRHGSLGGFLPNRFYQVVLTLTDLATNVLSSTINFQTFSETNFTFEAEDWNFDGGHWLDTIVLSSVSGPNNYLARAAVDDIDQHEVGTTGSQANYRPGLVGTEVTGDLPRQKYLNAQLADPGVHDYNVGWVSETEWLNYTRTFPTGAYNIYARLAYGGAGPYEASLAKVTGATTTTQTVTELGSFKGAVGRGGQGYALIPLTDAQSNRVVVSLSGVETLRATAASSGYNVNFYLLSPAERPALNIGRSGGKVAISWYQLSGETYVLENAPTVAGPWTNVLNQSNPFTPTATESARFFRLTYPAPPPPSTDVVVTFNDLPNGAVPASYAGLAWPASSSWAVGGPWGNLFTQNANWGGGNPTDVGRIEGGTGGAFLLKSVRATANSNWTLHLIDNNGQTASLVFTANTPARLTTGWTTNSAWVDFTSSVGGLSAVIDDLRYFR